VNYMKGLGYGLWQRLEPNDVYVEMTALRHHNARQSRWGRLRAFLGVPIG
jgi:hypothetical protein